jgi:hypothetical protein
MPLFNDRRNSSPAADIADYSNDSKPVSNPSLRAMGFPKKNTMMSKYNSDRFETAEYYGPGGKGAGPNAKANAAYQNSYIAKGKAASDAARATKPTKIKLLPEMGMTRSEAESRSKIAKANDAKWQTPGGLVLNELKKKK